MAIKFLAFLGKNRYTAGRYELNGHLSIHTPFSQVAVLDLLGSQNIAPDDVYIFLTSEARCKNWADAGSAAPASGVWLKDQLAELQHRLGFSVHDIAIPDEQDQEAIWGIFARVIDCLDTYDEVIFDVTHSFRYQPMLTLLALHFAKIAKRIRVAGIYYGNYEAGRVTAGSDAKTPDTPMPIVDLTAFSELQDWITNVYALLETGRAEPLSRWIEEKSAADSNAGADVHEPIRDLARRWQNLTDSLQTARSFFFQERAVEAMESIGKVEDSPVYHAFRPMTTLLKQVEEQIRPMVDSDPVRSGIGAIEWCYNHGLVQQTYTLIIELVISTVCWVEGREIRNQNHRNDAAGWLSKAVKQFAPSALHHGPDAGGPKEPKPSGEKEKAALRKLQQFPGLLDSYAQFNNLRNDLNHGAARRNPQPPEVFSQVFAANWPTLKKDLLRYWDSFSVGLAARIGEQ